MCARTYEPKAGHSLALPELLDIEGVASELSNIGLLQVDRQVMAQQEQASRRKWFDTMLSHAARTRSCDALDRLEVMVNEHFSGDDGMLHRLKSLRSELR